MNVLIACEESQRVCMAFRERGHNAFSCDIQEPSGRKACFTACACSTGSCPNIQCDEIEELYDIPASDAGLERIKCKDCHYNTGKCEDCLFQGNPEYCPEESED